MLQIELISNKSWIFLDSKDRKLSNHFYFVLATTAGLEIIAIQKNTHFACLGTGH